MRKIKVSLSIGYPTARQTDVIEVEDDVTDEDIDKAMQDWASNYISFSWDEV